MERPKAEGKATAKGKEETSMKSSANIYMARTKEGLFIKEIVPGTGIVQRQAYERVSSCCLSPDSSILALYSNDIVTLLETSSYAKTGAISLAHVEGLTISSLNAYLLAYVRNFIAKQSDVCIYDLRTGAKVSFQRDT